jgi:hypothetical protein
MLTRGSDPEDFRGLQRQPDLEISLGDDLLPRPQGLLLRLPRLIERPVLNPPQGAVIPHGRYFFSSFFRFRKLRPKRTAPTAMAAMAAGFSYSPKTDMIMERRPIRGKRKDVAPSSRRVNPPVLIS